MTHQPLTLDAIELGGLIDRINAAIARIENDFRDRDTLEAARSVRVEIRFAPERGRIAITGKVRVVLPPDETIPTVAAYNAKGFLCVNTGDPTGEGGEGQQTIDDAIEEVG